MKRQPLGINLASYIPLNSMLIYVMGIDARQESTRPPPQNDSNFRTCYMKRWTTCAIGFSLTQQGDRQRPCRY